MRTLVRGWIMELSCISRKPHHVVIIINMVILMLQDTHDILLTNYEDQEPVLRFDGVGGIVMSNVGSDRKTLLLIVILYLSRVKVTRIEISGLEIIGPNDDITYGEAMEDRLVKSNKFTGRDRSEFEANIK